MGQGPLRLEGEDLVLLLKVQPGAMRTDFAGRHGDAIKLRLAAPPVDGRANRELIRFLAAVCAVAPSAVELLAGESARHKRVRIRAPKRLPPGLSALLPVA